MKKIISVVLCMALLFGLCTVSAFAESEKRPLDLVYRGRDGVIQTLSYEFNSHYPNSYIRSLTFDASDERDDPLISTSDFSGLLGQTESITFRGSGKMYMFGYSVSGKGIFEGSAIQELYIPPNLYFLGEGAVALNWPRSSAIEYVSDENNLYYAAEYLFCSSSQLKKVTIDNVFPELWSGTFEDCTSLNEVVLTDKVENIAEAAFRGCTALEKITIPESVTTISYAAFLDSGLKNVYIPRSVTTIRNLAFGYNTKEGFNYDEVWNGTPLDQIGNIEKVEDFTIRGHKGTAAETYAIENGFTFVDVDDTQDEQTVYDSPGTVSALLGEYAEFDVTVGGSPAKIQFVNSKGSTITYTRDHANVTGITEIPNGSETWHVKLKVAHANETYTIRLRYGRTWTDADAPFTLTAKQPETGVVSAEVAASAVVGAPGVISVTVKNSPAKVQFTNSKGGTFTYTRDHASVSGIKSNGDGTETWTITLKVYRQSETYTARAKYSGSGWTTDGAAFTLAAE